MSADNETHPRIEKQWHERLFFDFLLVVPLSVGMIVGMYVGLVIATFLVNLM